jgi:Hypothetical protein (DUF2513)
MHRDMDLFRNVLIEAEKLPPDNPWSIIKIEGHTNEDVCYHVKLASDAGFIVAKFLPGIPEFAVERLTYAGHEFLDSAREDTLWAKAKDAVLKATGTLTIDGLKVALGALLHQAIKGQLGQ